jgi:peroxiredoxin
LVNGKDVARTLRLYNTKGENMLDVGSKAPDFTLLDQDGNNVSLSGLKGQKVVLWFYPKASSPG